MTVSPPVEFITNRLRLSACVPEDAQSLFENYTSNVSASEYLQRKVHTDISQTESFIQSWGLPSWRSSNQKFAWSISEIDHPAAIGLFILDASGPEAEIHFGLSPPYWGKGYAVEAGNTSLNWVKWDRHIKMISTVCDAEHHRSRQVLAKLGFTEAEKLDHHLLLPQKGDERRMAIRHLITFSDQ
jgi:[ribosomal protein S5]-alanine N-acetyltransferase